MAKTSKFDSVRSFIGKEVVVEYIQSGSEEITGTVKSIKDGTITLDQDYRGSHYRYRIPASETVYVKGESGEIAKDSTVTLERSINKRVKVKGMLIGVDPLGLILDRGEIRGKVTTQVISASTFETITYGEYTEEGEKARKAHGKRLKEARAERDSGKTKKAGKAGKSKKSKK